VSLLNINKKEREKKTCTHILNINLFLVSKETYLRSFQRRK
jgi:hypothetical protein